MTTREKKDIIGSLVESWSHVSQDKQKCSEESPEILTSMLGFPMQLE
jgi:hypothetical protein